MLALLYDVHGNLPALDAVIEDAEAAGATEWLVGGDVCAFGGWPVECLARLRTLAPARWLRGNHERWAVERDEVPDGPLARGGTDALRDALDETTIAALYALPPYQPIPGGEAWHGSPRSDALGFLPEPGPDDAERLLGRTPGLLVAGHTHLPMRRDLVRGDGGTTAIVNPGSVGLPFDGDPRAAYGLLHDDAHVERRRIDYDTDRAVARQLERWGAEGWSGIVAGTLKSGRPGPPPAPSASAAPSPPARGRAS